MAITNYKSETCVHCKVREESVTIVFREPNGLTTLVPLCIDCARRVWDFTHWGKDQ